MKESPSGRNDILLLSTEKLPEDIRVHNVFQMIQFTGQVELSKKGLIKGFLDRNRNEYQEVLDNFIALAPKEANAIIGIKIETCIGQFSNGAYIFITYYGTPAKLIQAKGTSKKALK